MMFVNVGDVDGKPATKEYTEKWTSLWQNSLHNNHIDVQVSFFFFFFFFFGNLP